MQDIYPFWFEKDVEGYKNIIAIPCILRRDATTEDLKDVNVRLIINDTTYYTKDFLTACYDEEDNQHEKLKLKKGIIFGMTYILIAKYTMANLLKVAKLFIVT